MKPHWLSRPGTIRLLWRAFAALLAATVGAQWLVPVRGHFGQEAWFGFSAAYGFLACVGMVLLARLIGLLLKRRDDFYAGGDDDA